MTSRAATPNADSDHDIGLFCATNVSGILLSFPFFPLVELSAAYTIPAYTFSYIAGEKVI